MTTRAGWVAIVLCAATVARAGDLQAEIDQARADVAHERDGLAEAQALLDEARGKNKHVSVAQQAFDEQRQALERAQARLDGLLTRAREKPLPKVDPCAYFDEAARASAQGWLDHEQQLRAKLSARIDDLLKWRNNLKQQSREYDRLREVSAVEEISEVMKAIPAEQMLRGLQKLPQLEDALSDLNMGRILTAYQAAQTALAAGKLLSTDQSSEQLKQALAAARHARGAILAYPVETLPHDVHGEEARKLVKGADKSLELIALACGYLADGQPRSRTGAIGERYEREGKLIVEIGAVFFPVAVGSTAAVVNVAEMETRRALGRAAVERFTHVIGENWNAERYLREKLERVDANIVELSRITQCRVAK